MWRVWGQRSAAVPLDPMGRPVHSPALTRHDSTTLTGGALETGERTAHVCAINTAECCEALFTDTMKATHLDIQSLS